MDWIRMQNDEKCCGCGSLTDEWATGDLCGTVQTTCFSWVVDHLMGWLEVLTYMCIISVFAVLFGIISAVCLSCCANPSDAKRQQTVVRMPDYEWLPEDGRHGSNTHAFMPRETTNSPRNMWDSHQRECQNATFLHNAKMPTIFPRSLSSRSSLDF